MNRDKIIGDFRETGALLEGHFVLSSGLHSATYLQCARALQYPADAIEYGRAIAESIGHSEIETVASPAIGGLLIGYATAEAMNKRFIWTERQNGEMMLRRGFSVRPGERVLVVEDVITTGGSVKECIDVLKSCGAEIVCGASIIDRSGGKADIGIPRVSLVEMDVKAYMEEECPMCAEGIPAIKPGSRTA